MTHDLDGRERPSYDRIELNYTPSERDAAELGGASRDLNTLTAERYLA